ncbi:hypothetical protein DAEQUDRAFT_733178 [Daedalea quercina L-15889]|uniref:Uncharacterized protein n=1 Tax=Daedalea quercina L-15889 TaxID=1314783 RepID=A0A165L746_9APHY|nr:hypothetical protein DAEQUDRAFT_733178 [Daedalea quercina L-15889]
MVRRSSSPALPAAPTCQWRTRAARPRLRAAARASGATGLVSVLGRLVAVHAAVPIFQPYRVREEQGQRGRSPSAESRCEAVEGLVLNGLFEERSSVSMFPVALL